MIEVVDIASEPEPGSVKDHICTLRELLTVQTELE